MADERISPEDVEFDSAGRVIITNPQMVARLRGQFGEEAEVKNVGCCSVSDLVRDPSVSEAISRFADQAAVKNVGCCSVSDLVRDPSVSEAISRFADQAAVKNVGCCSVEDLEAERGLPAAAPKTRRGTSRSPQ